MSLPTFATQSSRRLLQRLPLGVCSVADTHVHHRPVAAAAAIVAMFLCNDGGHVADGEAGEGAHHENVPIVQQHGGDGVRAHAAQLVLQKTFNTRKKKKTSKLKTRLMLFCFFGS